MCFKISDKSPVPLQLKTVLKFSSTSIAEQQSSNASKVPFVVLILQISTICSFQQGAIHQFPNVSMDMAHIYVITAGPPHCQGGDRQPPPVPKELLRINRRFTSIKFIVLVLRVLTFFSSVAQVANSAQSTECLD